MHHLKAKRRAPAYSWALDIIIIIIIIIMIIISRYHNLTHIYEILLKASRKNT